MVKTKGRENTQSVSRSFARSPARHPSQPNPLRTDLVITNSTTLPIHRTRPTRAWRSSRRAKKSLSSLHHSHRAFSRARRASHRVVTIHPVKTQRVIIRARKTRTACARTVVADLGLAVCASRKPNRKISFVSPRPGFILSRVSRRAMRHHRHVVHPSRRHSGFQPFARSRFSSTYRAARRRAKGDGGLRRGKHILSSACVRSVCGTRACDCRVVRVVVRSRETRSPADVRRRPLSLSRFLYVQTV